MKALLAFICALVVWTADAIPPQVVYNPLDTNAVGLGQETFVLTWHNGKPVFLVNTGGGTGGTNVFVTITVSNFFAGNTYVQNSFTTNLTIAFPGGATNLNLIPNTLMVTDPLDAEASLPNARGILTNSGTAFGWSTTFSLDELDALNAYLTNVFTFLTNDVLYTDGNGIIKGEAGPSAGTYGDGTHVPVVTVDPHGVVTVVSSTAITGAAPTGSAGGVLSGNYPNPGFANPDTFPGPVTVPSLTNTGNMLMKGTETNSSMGAGVIHSDSLGGRSSSAVVNSDLANSTVTFTGTANEISGGGSTALGASATPFAFTSPSLFPGAVAVAGLTNTSNTLLEGTETNTSMGVGVIHSDSHGGRTSSAVANADLANSSLTISGTANQVSVSGGGPVTLGGTATLSLPNPLFAPGSARVSGLTNTSNTLLQGTETNSSMGAGVLHSDSLGGRSSSAVVNADLQNSIMTIQGITISLGGSANVVSYDTNAIPSSGALTFGHSYDTNMQADITLPAFTLDPTRYETLTIQTTNSTGTDHKWTMPAGVRVAIANGGGNTIWCTNERITAVYVEHDGLKWTNCWKNDF